MLFRLLGGRFFLRGLLLDPPAAGGGKRAGGRESFTRRQCPPLFRNISRAAAATPVLSPVPVFGSEIFGRYGIGMQAGGRRGCSQLLGRCGNGDGTDRLRGVTEELFWGIQFHRRVWGGDGVVDG